MMNSPNKVGAPFSLTTSNTLGTSHSSLENFGPLIPCKTFGQAQLKSVINLASGNVIFQDKQFEFPDVGDPVRFSYIYNSQANPGWRLAYGRQIKKTDDALILIEADGAEVLYKLNREDGFYYPDQYENTRPKVKLNLDQTFSWFNPQSNVTEIFSTTGLLIAHVDASGNQTHYEYKEGILQAILATSGARYEFKHTQINQKQEKIEVSINKNKESKRLHTYTLTDGQLTSSITQDQYQIDYQYKKGLLTLVKQTDASTLTLSYEANKLVAIKVGSDSANTHQFSYANHQTTFTDPAGSKRTLIYDQNNRPLALTINENKYLYQFTKAGQIEQISYPNQSIEKFEYDSLTGLVTKHTERNGSYTVYHYSNDDNHVLLKKVFYDQHNKAHPTVYLYQTIKEQYPILQFEISAQGRVKQYVVNSDNGLIKEERQFTNDLYPVSQGIPSSTLMHDWIKDKKISSAHFDYDDQGRINIIRKGDGETQFLYDDYGSVIKTSIKYDVKQYTDVTKQFDHLGRPTLLTDSANTKLAQQRTITYIKNQSETVQPNGRKEVTTWNDSGEMVEEKISIPNSKEEHKQCYKHYPQNRAVVVNDLDGYESFQFFDHHQKLKADVSAAGKVTLIERNPSKRYIVRSQFAKPIDKKSLFVTPSYYASYRFGEKEQLSFEKLEDQLKNKETANEVRREFTFLGMQDEVRYEVDADSYLIEYCYNSKGEILHSIRYNEKLNSDEWQILLSGNELPRAPNRATDEIYSKFYDLDGLLIATQDPAGYVREMIREGSGRITEETLFHTPVLTFADDLNHIRPETAPGKDAYHYYFYDSNDQCNLEVDAEGYITTHNYYADLKLKSSKRYETPVDVSWFENTKCQPQAQPSTNDHETEYTYDGLRRTQTIHNPSGATTVFTYDEMNHVVSEHTRDLQSQSTDGDHFRGNETQFDKWGKKIAIANAFVTQKLANEPESQKLIWKNNSLRNTFKPSGLKLFSIDPNGKKTLYYYDEDKNPIFEVDGTGAIFEVTLNGYNEVIEERHYYNRLPKRLLDKLEGGYLTAELNQQIKALRDAKDAVTKLTRNKRGLVESKIDPEEYLYQFKYDAFKRCVVENIPVTNKNPTLTIKHEYEPRGLETRTIKHADGKTIEIKKVYQHPLGKLTDIHDAVGGYTQYEHDRLGNQDLTKKIGEDGKEIIVELRSHDGFARPTVITNADNETLKIQFNDKMRTQTINPASQPEHKTVVINNIFHEPINQVTTAQGKVLLQESFAHTPTGQVCQHVDGNGLYENKEYNLSGEVASITDKTQTKTLYIRNQAGQLTSQIIGEKSQGLGFATSMEPNAFGQNEIVTDHNGHTVRNEYDKKGGITKSISETTSGKAKPITQYKRNATGEITEVVKGDEKNPNQYQEHYERNNFNQVRAKIIDPAGLNLKTEYEYDNAAHVIKLKDPKGYEKRSYYNLLQQKRYELNDLNANQIAAVEYQYTEGGKPKSIREYAVPIDKNKLLEQPKLADIKSLITPSTNDTITYLFYDEVGNEQFRLHLVYSYEKNKFEAVVTENIFDGAHRIIKIINCANLIDANDIDLSTKTIAERVKNSADPTRDRINYYWYDKASNEVLVVNQEGAVTEKVYKNSHVVKQIDWLKPLNNPEAHLKDDLTSVRALVSANPQDRITHFIRDGLGRLQFKVLPNGQVIKQRFDANNNLTLVCKFKDRFIAPENNEKMLSALNQLVPVPGKDGITEKVYDEANHVQKIIYTLNENKKLTETFERNALGNVELYTDRATQQWRYQYDRAQRLTDEISPETTVTLVKKDGNKLTACDIRSTVTKHTDFDANNNAKKITDGIVDNKLVLDKGFSEEKRIFTASYQANNELASTAVHDVPVDDGTSYSKDWNDFKKLPYSTKTISTEILRNAFGQKIADKNAADKWSFYIRDNLGRVVYEIKNEKAVIEYTYDAFGEVENERRYAVPSSFDVAQYIKTGITVDQISKMVSGNKILLQQSDADRLTIFKRNANNKLISVQSGPVYFYSNGTFGKASPETIKNYNVFGDQIYEAKLIRPGIWAENYVWPDKNGNPIATLDPNRYVTIYERDPEGHEINRIEYANALNINTTEIATVDNVDQLKNRLQLSPRDRKYESEYNSLNQKVSERLFIREGASENFINPTTQKLTFTNGNIPKLENVTEPLTKRWTYTPTEQLESSIHEDDGVEYKYHDERGLLIGETGVARTQYTSGKTITPLTRYRLNPFGQTAVIETSAEGCEKSSSTKLPSFKKPDHVGQEIFLYDVRGLFSRKEDREHHLTAYMFSPSKKLVRQLQTANIWHKNANSFKENLNSNWVDIKNDHSNVNVPNAPTKLVYKGAKQGWVTEGNPKNSKTKSKNLTSAASFTNLPHIDEKYIAYDDLDRPVHVRYLREGVEEQSLYSNYNIFSDVIGEGENGKDWPLYRKIDPRGLTWSTNEENGANSILLYDLSGEPTLKLQAPKDDLGLIQYDDLPATLQWDAKKLERHEKTLDSAGRALEIKSPVWFKDQPAQPTHSYGYDRWNNILNSKDGLGNQTELEYDDRNHLLRQTQPEVNTVDIYAKTSKIRPVTVNGYNQRGIKIGTQDANQHTTGWILDEAGQVISTILPDGLKEEINSYDALNHLTAKSEARGTVWSYQYNNLGKVTLSTFPSGKTIANTYDSSGNISATQHPSGTIDRYNYDVRGNCWEHYVPLGQCVRTAYDHNGQPLALINVAHSTQSWERDYFGNAIKHTDYGGRVIDYDYNFNKNLIHQYSKNGPDRLAATIRKDKYDYKVGKHALPFFAYAVSSGKVANQNITYNYTYNVLDEVDDQGLGKKTSYDYDLANRRDKVLIRDAQGKVLHDIKSTYDALGRDIYTEDNHESVLAKPVTIYSATGYDPVGNLRRIYTQTSVPGYDEIYCTPTVTASDYWFTYDSANRVLMNAAPFLNGQIQLMAGLGNEFEYVSGYRVREKSILPNGKPVTVTLEHNPDGLLQNTIASSGLRTERGYHPNGWNDHYKEYGGLAQFNTDLKANENGWITNQDYKETFKGAEGQHNITDFDGHDNIGLPNHEKTINWLNGHAATDNYNISYVGLDDWAKTIVSGNRRTDTGVSKQNTAQIYYDANGSLNAKLNSDDEIDIHTAGNNDLFSSNAAKNAYYETNYDGKIYSKQYLKGDRPDFNTLNQTYHYFHKPTGEMIGGYWIQYDLTRMTSDEWFHRVPVKGSQETKPLFSGISLRTPVRPVGKANVEDKKKKADPLGWNDPLYPGLGPQIYVVQPGDNLANIAQKLYGDQLLAEQIALGNGLPSIHEALKPGYVLTVPPILTSHNKADNARPYHDFINLLTGRLTPHLETPKPKAPKQHDDFLGILVKALAVGIVMAVAPALAPALLSTIGVATTGVNIALATGAIDAIGDAAVQGLAIGLGVQSEFSINEMFETGLTGGVLSGADGLADMAFKVGTSNVAAQLTEMAAGLRDKFDARAVALQVSSSIVNWQVSKGIKSQFGDGRVGCVVNTAARTATSSILGSAVTGTPINIQNMAANAIGSVVADEAGRKLVDGDATQNTTELDDAEEVAQMKLDDPGLTISDHRYGDVSYELSEMNRERMNKWSSSEMNSSETISANDNTFGFWKKIGRDVLDYGMSKFAEQHPYRATEVAAGLKIVDDVMHPLQTLQRLGEGIIYGTANLITDPTVIFKETLDLYSAYNNADPITQGKIEAELYEGILLPGAPIGIYKTAPGLTKWTFFGERNLYPERSVPMHDLNIYLDREIKISSVKDVPKTFSLPDLESRSWYHSQLRNLLSFLDPTKSLIRQAYKANKIRNEFKLQARELMEDQEMAVGFPPPKSFKETVLYYQAKGFEGDNLWQEIIDASQRTNEVVDRAAGVKNDFAVRRNKP